MKLLFDFFPILLFFIAYKLADIFVATAVIIAASALQVMLYWWKHRRFDKTHLITLAAVVIFGGATLILRDGMFIMWKPTVVYWLLAAACILSSLIGGKTLIERMLGHAVSVPKFVWSRVNHGWTVFFAALGALNLYVAYNFDEPVWVNFKLFGVLGLTLTFLILQAMYMGRYMKPQPDTNKEL